MTNPTTPGLVDAADTPPVGPGANPRLGRLMTTAEVASAFSVAPKTVTRWSKDGLLSTVRTPGGHRRFKESEVNALLEGNA